MHSSFRTEVISIPDSELSVLGGGKKWENLLSLLGLVLCKYLQQTYLFRT